jgi:hypothetical protein
MGAIFLIKNPNFQVRNPLVVIQLGDNFNPNTYSIPMPIIYSDQ